MLKNLLMFLMLGMVAALSGTALGANNWDGGGAAGVWADPLNWTGDVLPINEFATEEARIDNTTVPVIASGNNTEWDRARIKNSTVTQTGGTHRWRNYTSTSGLALHRDTAMLHMTGGTHYAERVILGDDIFATPETFAIDGVGIINIWGSGTFVVEPNTFDDPLSDIYQVHYLWILDGGSKIDIRDSGKLRVPLDMISTIDDYTSAGKIIAGEAGKSLATATIGDEYVVSVGLGGDFDVDGDVDGNDFLVWQQGFGTDYDANDLTEWENNFGTPGASVTVVAAAVPEPASVLLALLGLGLLAAAQRRENRGN